MIKKLFSVALVAIMCVSISMASAKQKEVVVVSTTKQVNTQQSVIATSQFITNINGDKEAKLVASKLSKVDGVVNVDVNQKSKIVDIRYNNQKTNNTEILKAFKRANVSAKLRK